MDTNVQPSFIPKKPVSQPGPKPIRTTSFFSIIATVLFVTALVLAVIVFAYKFFLNKRIETKQEDLQAELDKFEPKLVQELSRLDTRMNAAADLIKNHFATTYFLSILSNVTLKNVQYNTLTLTNTDQKGVILMQGKAQSFTAVALQFDELTKPDRTYSKYFKDVTVVNPNLDNDGNVTFNVNGNIDLSNLTYPIAHAGVTLSATKPIAGTTTAATTTKATQ